MKRILCTVLAGLLCLSLLAGCQQNPPEPAPTPVPSAAPTAEPTLEPAPTPIPTPFVPAEDLIPTPTPAPEGTEPAPTDEDFEAAFSQNPIDKAYDEDYRRAMSFSMMRQACDTAARRWREMADGAYLSALGVVAADQTAPLTASHEDWRLRTENKIQSLREDAGDDNESLLEAARQVVLLYREEAKAMCKAYYDVRGTLPLFPQYEEGAVG